MQPSEGIPRPPDGRRPAFERLERAFALYLTAEESASPPSHAALLESHPDLRDILEPLLAPAAEPSGQQPPEDEPEPRDHPLVGRVLGGFRILAPLGRGGMGLVFEAEQVSIGRRVALKVLSAERRLDPHSMARFRREATALGRLAHPAIVAVIDYGEEQGVQFLAQELVEGGRTLEDFLEESRRRAGLDASYYRTVARLFAEVGEALAAAHAQAIVHRDVKPGNVLLTDAGQAKLADFGLARMSDSLTVSLSGAIGTPFYMSPEQAAGDAVGPASDQFSLGVALYEALALRRPFEGDTSQQVMRAVREEEPRDPRRLHSRIPADLAVICLRALEKKPQHRYADAATLAADLRRFLAGEPIVARTPSAWRRVLRLLRRRPLLTTASGLAIVAVAIGALFLAQLAYRDREIVRLSDEIEIGQLLAMEATLYPAYPPVIGPAADWLGKARHLLDRRDDHQRALGELRASAGLAADAVAPVRLPDARSQLIHEMHVRLLEGLDELQVRAKAVEQRVAMAERVRRETLDDESVEQQLAAVRAHPRYGGLALGPQVGLVPLGHDPDSGLLEFAHLLTGEVPRRGSDGRLELRGEHALVLVLVPGGEFLMGYEPEDPAAPPHLKYPVGSHLYPRAVGAFLLAKHEMTQAQWTRATGRNPSFFASRPDQAMLPVEQVSWDDCDRVLGQIGLRLPREVEWEYACRAGTRTMFSWGQDWRLFPRFANVKDLSNGQGEPNRYEPLADGFEVIAPIDSLLPNAFGLHEMHGNIAEWCADFQAPYPGLELTSLEDAKSRIIRGGAYHAKLDAARSSYRGGEPPGFRYRTLGVRPAADLVP